ncbi:DNA cytosine methyltransferase [Amycolatopsis thailandensis]|uniref:DNA cytosine methyltransferase n=1 Tax=Amycolatopsis thailandensis TaxID=589330 RepID=UPI003667A452
MARGTKAPRVLSCFSGAGGLDLGLHAAGFQTIGCLEIDEDARATLIASGRGWKVFDDGDVSLAGRNLTPADLGLKLRELELLAGGPPCQPYSKAAQWTSKARHGLQDPRAQSLHGMLQLVESFLPRVLLIENVVGFTGGQNSAKPLIDSALAGINQRNGTEYALNVFELDAADYGTPQHRLRAICVAVRDGSHFSRPQVTHPRPLTAWDALRSLPADADAPIARGKWAKLLPCIPEGENYLHLTARGGGPEIFGYRTRFWSFLLKLAKDRPSWTLPASPGPSAGPFHWDNRPLTVRERLALQGFPKDYLLQGELRSQISLAGNATPPPLAEIIGRELIMQGLIELPQGFPAKPVLPVKRARSTPPPAAARRLPREFKALVGEKEAHKGAGLGPAPRKPMAASGE